MCIRDSDQPDRHYAEKRGVRAGCTEERGGHEAEPGGVADLADGTCEAGRADEFADADGGISTGEL